MFYMIKSRKRTFPLSRLPAPLTINLFNSSWLCLSSRERKKQETQAAGRGADPEDPQAGAEERFPGRWCWSGEIKVERAPTNRHSSYPTGSRHRRLSVSLQCGAGVFSSSFCGQAGATAEGKMLIRVNVWSKREHAWQQGSGSRYHHSAACCVCVRLIVILLPPSMHPHTVTEMICSCDILMI